MSWYQAGLVRAEFTTGVGLDTMMTLDGLLFALLIRSPEERVGARQRRAFWRAARKFGLETAIRFWQEKNYPIPEYTHTLPLKVWGHGVLPGVWVFAASYAEPETPWEYDVAHWTRRVDSLEAIRWLAEEALPSRIEVGKGPYRSYYESLRLLATRSLTWHVCGDLAAIERILGEAMFIGKKRSQGHGMIKRWVVEAEDRDRSVWDGDQLNRPVPVDLLDALGIEGEFEYGYYAFRPPYHDARYFTRCAMRGVRKPRSSQAGKGVSGPFDVAALVRGAFGGE